MDPSVGERLGFGITLVLTVYFIQVRLGLAVALAVAVAPAPAPALALALALAISIRHHASRLLHTGGHERHAASVRGVHVARRLQPRPARLHGHRPHRDLRRPLPLLQQGNLSPSPSPSPSPRRNPNPNPNPNLFLLFTKEPHILPLWVVRAFRKFQAKLKGGKESPDSSGPGGHTASSKSLQDDVGRANSRSSRRGSSSKVRLGPDPNPHPNPHPNLNPDPDPDH